MNYNVASYLQLRADEQPNAIALKVPKKGLVNNSIVYESLTFDELNRDANCCASMMQQEGIESGERVLLMVKPGKELLTFAFALFKLGAVPILIDPGMGVKSLVRCVEQTKPTVLIGIPQAHVLSLVFKKYFVSLKKRITVGYSLGWGGVTYKKMLQKGNCLFKDFFASKKDLAAILFTSGSTGAPKGVCYQHGHFHAQMSLLKSVFLIKPGGIDLPMLPIFALFNPALGLQTVVPKMHPGKPVALKPELIVSAIMEEKITQSFGSPILWKKIEKYCSEKKIVLNTLKCVLIAGAPVPPLLLVKLKDVMPNAKIYTPYGATEALPISCIESNEIIKETRALTESGKGMCVGEAMKGVSILIIKESSSKTKNFSECKVLKNEQRGEIIVSGSVVTESYDLNPTATENAKINEDGKVWHRMGDLGYLDKQNRLWFCGRKTHKVSCVKETFYSICCEAIFNVHKNISRSALISIGTGEHKKPAIVIESKSCEKRNVKKILKELKILACSKEHTQSITTFFCKKDFPVDVRHNAKIHRDELAQWAKNEKDLSLW